MKHTELYNSLVTRGITTWDDTVIAVIELEDNLEIKEATSTPSETASIQPSQATAPSMVQMVASYIQSYFVQICPNSVRNLHVSSSFALLAMRTIPQVSVPHFNPNISILDIKAIGMAMRAKTIDFAPLINMLLGLWQPLLSML